MFALLARAELDVTGGREAGRVLGPAPWHAACYFTFEGEVPWRISSIRRRASLAP
jgi:hypothetical protein